MAGCPVATFRPKGDRVRAAPQPAENAASSADPHLHRYSPPDRGSNSRPRRPDPAFAYPLAGPVSPDTSNPTIPAQPSPRACTHVVSARKWTYYRWAAHQPDLPAGAQGCGRHSLKICAAPATKRPPLHIAAAAVRCLPKLETARAHVPPSAHGVRIPARCARAGPDGGPRAVACCLGAVRGTFRPGGRQPGARSTHRPQAVVIPRLRHLGWPRMRGVAPERSHYARSRGAGWPRRPNRPPRPRVAVQAMADGSPGAWEHRKSTGSDMYFLVIHKLRLLVLRVRARALRFEPPSQPTAVSLLPGLT